MKRLSLPPAVGAHLGAVPLLALLIGFLVVPIGWIFIDSFSGSALDLTPYVRAIASEHSH
jgi:hypothetical protein